MKNKYPLLTIMRSGSIHIIITISYQRVIGRYVHMLARKRFSAYILTS
jgi:hypothetical protein